MVKHALRRLAVAAILLVVGVITGWLYIAGAGRGDAQPARAVTHAHTGPSIEQVQALASLVVLKVQVADVQVSELRGYTGGITIALIVKGEVTLATDLSAATFESLDQEHRQAVLVLPSPQISRPCIDHDRTHVLFVRRSGLWQLGSAERSQAIVTNRAYAEAQRLIERAATAADASLQLQAQRHAQEVLQAFFKSMDWTLKVRWITLPIDPT